MCSTLTQIKKKFTGIPDADACFSILNVLLSKTPYDVSLEELKSLASQMHAYVGADISAVVREAGTIAIKRWLNTSGQEQISQLSPIVSLKLTLQDIVSAMPLIRPFAMRSIFVETSPVRYSDIGGQASVI